MNKSMACFGAMFALGAMTCGAEAKKVYYEIDGQRYWYSTNNRQQVREARERINAANAADAAKAKAQAERAANPLAAVFGSPAQAAAKEAEARARQAVAGQPGSAAAGGAETAASEARETRRARRRVAREVRRTQRIETARAAPGRLIQASAAPKPERPSASKAAAKEPAGTAPAPAVKSVFYDLSTGIKTVQMSDGTVHEEPFDAGSEPRLGSGAAGDLTEFVNGLRKPSPEDATGTLAKAFPQN
jgi:membrane protein involved in colicin uptake